MFQSTKESWRAALVAATCCFLATCSPREEAVTPADPPVAPPEPSLRTALARFHDTSIALRQREREVTALGVQPDPRAVRLLMALGDSDSCLARQAVEALSRRHEWGVEEYLRGKLSSTDSRMVMAAARAYARNRGEEGIPDLVYTLAASRNLDDGRVWEVRSELVRVLARLRDTSVVPVLAGELAGLSEPGWSLEHGSVVVAGLGLLDTDEGRRAARTYAGRLARLTPDDALARGYYEAKVAQALAAAEERPDLEPLGDAI